MTNTETEINDHAGAAEYAEQFERKTWRMALEIGGFVMLLASLALNLWQWRRPPLTYVARVDEVGRAEAIHFGMNDYTPREAEVVTALHTWATDRFRLLKPVIATNFKENYQFLDARLSRQLAITDADVVAKIQAGGIGEQDIRINSVSFRAFDTVKRSDGTVGSGECVIDLDKLYNVTGPGAKEHWLITVRYDLNPSAAAQQDQAFQVANPLGLRITWFHEDRAGN